MSLAIGDKAPNFNVNDQNGQATTLEQFKGKKVVLYFYPKDDTPGCTAQACNLRDNYESLLSKGYVVLGVSADTEQKHQKFIEKYDLPFPLLADTEKEIIESYGIWKEKKTFGKTYMGIVRTTFVINEEGIVEEIIEKVKTADHTQQILG